MDQRQLDKEHIRLTRELATLEAQLSSAQRGKEEKIEENKQILDEITGLEDENKVLEEEIQRLDSEIAELDEEFKQAQLDAGKLRREIKIQTERAEGETKQIEGLRNNITKLEHMLEGLKREVKSEIDDRRSLEGRLRKTKAHIDAMKQHRLSQIVTNKLEKQDWYNVASGDFTDMDGSDTFESDEPEPVAVVDKPAEEKKSAVPDNKKVEKEDGLDFSED